jgi:hypothetical protein
VDLHKVQVLILDTHDEGPFDSVWDRLFSRRRPTMRMDQINKLAAEGAL